jgi:hypothetical protein
MSGCGSVFGSGSITGGAGIGLAGSSAGGMTGCEGFAADAHPDNSRKHIMLPKTTVLNNRFMVCRFCQALGLIPMRFNCSSSSFLAL